MNTPPVSSGTGREAALRVRSLLLSLDEPVMKQRTYVYIDGFNRYYGAFKGTPYKWLNLQMMCELLLPKNEVVRIKYFTARVNGRTGDPNQAERQQIYLRALRTIPNLEIIYGHFLTHTVSMRVANPGPNEPKYVSVLKTEEKGSDVNIAAHLINDGYQKRYWSLAKTILATRNGLFHHRLHGFHGFFV